MLTIRIAEESDAGGILTVTRKSFVAYRDSISVAVSLGALTETADDVRNDIINKRVYIAENETKIVGSIRFELLNKDIAYIFRFGVDPETKSTGVGTKLLARAVEDITALGAKAVTLHTNSKYYQLARYYYGKEFYVHSTDDSKGYIRAYFVKELTPDGLKNTDITIGMRK
jgi:predicted N-acetyltransferase YhbS